MIVRFWRGWLVERAADESDVSKFQVVSVGWSHADPHRFREIHGHVAHDRVIFRRSLL